jgi:hypothetical protein
LRVYVHLFVIRATLYAIDWTNINASQLLRTNAGLTYYVGQTSRSASALLEVIGIDRRKMLPLLGNIVFGEDGLDRARRLASSAINAFIRVYVEHFGRLEIRLVLSRVDAIDRTNIHTGRVLSPYAGLSNNVCHLRLSLLSNVFAAKGLIPETIWRICPEQSIANHNSG